MHTCWKRAKLSRNGGHIATVSYGVVFWKVSGPGDPLGVTFMIISRRAVSFKSFWTESHGTHPKQWFDLIREAKKSVLQRIRKCQAWRSDWWLIGAQLDSFGKPSVSVNRQGLLNPARYLLVSVKRFVNLGTADPRWSRDVATYQDFPSPGGQRSHCGRVRDKWHSYTMIMRRYNVMGLTDSRP